jgi:hypothetical protein
MAWATISLPVPLAPVTSTGKSVTATLRIRSKTFNIAGQVPTMLSNPWDLGVRADLLNADLFKLTTEPTFYDLATRMPAGDQKPQDGPAE